jgi:hypothetical protein
MIYHRLPAELVGDTLHPLNVLRDVAPTAYASQVAKYVGREQLRDEVVVPLGVLWNDVLHFSPVHPESVRAGFRRAGLSWPEGQTWIEVDPWVIGMSADNACVFFSRLAGESWFAPYAEDLISENADLPADVADYYAACAAAGTRPLVFNGVMHVLYRGSIDTRLCGRVVV